MRLLAIAFALLACSHEKGPPIRLEPDAAVDGPPDAPPPRTISVETFGTMPLEKVARVVFHAGTTPRPRSRYNVGFWANFGPVGRYLAGDRVVDWWMSREIPHDKPRKDAT